MGSTLSQKTLEPCNHHTFRLYIHNWAGQYWARAGYSASRSQPFILIKWQVGVLITTFHPHKMLLCFIATYQLFHIFVRFFMASSPAEIWADRRRRLGRGRCWGGRGRWPRPGPRGQGPPSPSPWPGPARCKVLVVKWIQHWTNTRMSLSYI